MVKYEGLFFEGEMEKVILSIEENNLGLMNDLLHCTFKYHPKDDEIFKGIAGKYFDVYLTHYGNNGKNSGFLVTLPESLQKYYINYDENKNLKTPHITVSLKEGEEAKNTQYLEFKKMKKPVKVTGRFGFWLEDEKGEYLSFEIK